jgi:hypothetical protein
VLHFFGVFGLSFMALLFGASGACFVIVINDLPSDWQVGGLGFLIGLMSAVAAGLCIWGAVFLTKRGK